MMKRFILLALLAAGCSQPLPQKNNEDKVVKGINKIDHLLWLIGGWKSVSDGGTIYEEWDKKSEKIFAGKSFLMKGDNVIFAQQMAIQQNGAELYYSLTISTQNKGLPITFRFMGFRDGEFIFENTENDFPQRIIYKNPQPDFLCIRYEGIKDGNLRKEDFNFVKVQ